MSPVTRTEPDSLARDARRCLSFVEHRPHPDGPGLGTNVPYLEMALHAVVDALEVLARDVRELKAKL
jgi:hypothetical protein